MDSIAVERLIIKLREQKSEISNQIRKRHNAISEINLKLKRDLPIHEYKRTAREREVVKNELVELQSAISDLKLQIMKKEATKEELKLGEEIHIDTSDGVKSQIAALRKKYMQFSSDKTRVSSMRIMASEFVQELDALIL